MQLEVGAFYFCLLKENGSTVCVGALFNFFPKKRW